MPARDTWGSLFSMKETGVALDFPLTGSFTGGQFGPELRMWGEWNLASFAQNKLQVLNSAPKRKAPICGGPRPLGKHDHARLDVLGRAGVLVLGLAANWIVASPVAHAGSFVVDFSTTQAWDQVYHNPALWDVTNKRIASPPSVTVGGSLKPMSFGGRERWGVWRRAPQTGITVSGTSITVDTDIKATYNFTTFSLSHPVTLTATGSKPLTIYVLGSATIAGTISVSGAPGQEMVRGHPKCWPQRRRYRGCGRRHGWR